MHHESERVETVMVIGNEQGHPSFNSRFNSFIFLLVILAKAGICFFFLYY